MGPDPRTEEAATLEPHAHVFGYTDARMPKTTKVHGTYTFTHV